MLVLTRRAGQAVRLGNDIRLTLVKIRGGQVRLAIDAPRNVLIQRDELEKPGEAISVPLHQASPLDPSASTATA